MRTPTMMDSEPQRWIDPSDMRLIADLLETLDNFDKVESQMANPTYFAGRIDVSTNCGHIGSIMRFDEANEGVDQYGWYFYPAPLDDHLSNIPACAEANFKKQAD